VLGQLAALSVQVLPQCGVGAGVEGDFGLAGQQQAGVGHKAQARDAGRLGFPAAAQVEAEGFVLELAVERAGLGGTGEQPQLSAALISAASAVVGRPIKALSWCWSSNSAPLAAPASESASRAARGSGRPAPTSAPLNSASGRST
jgi:hypothetical protein